MSFLKNRMTYRDFLICIWVIVVSFSFVKTSLFTAPRDELREIFNDISSSSDDEEDDGDRQEDEDLNIVDTEDDMVGRIHEKLNGADAGRDESSSNGNQIGNSCVPHSHVWGQRQVQNQGCISANQG